MLIWSLRIFFGTVLLTMIATTILASFQQSMFAIPSEVTGNPWFIATLLDAYFGFLTFTLWVWYRSRSWTARIFWLILILLLGNMAMAVYALLIVCRLPSTATAKDVLLRPALTGKSR